MRKMIEVYDKNFKKLGVIENAYSVKTDENLNAVDFLHFKLRLKDRKTNLCKPFNFVKHYDKYYRIMPRNVSKSISAVIEYTCEHAIATLIDTVLFGSHTVGNRGYYTDQVIRYVLSRQSRWTLGRCDFRRQFEYHWEQENLLAALMSITKPFSDDYMWEFGTKENPFQINLIRLSDEVKAVYMPQKNIIETSIEDEPTQICTRLYPLGAGEGINQVNIKKINGGLPYIQSPADVVAKYGIIERVWVDRRHENAQTLLESAKALLKEMQEPRVSFEILASDLKGEVGIGDKVRIIDKELNIDKVTHVKKLSRGGNNKAVSLEISNKKSSIANSIAALADRQRIESTYSQGATQIYAQSIQANASPEDAAELHFYIPEEMIQINKILIKIKTEKFRAYSKATSGGGAVSSTTSAGGGTFTTSESGGGVRQGVTDYNQTVNWGWFETRSAGDPAHIHEMHLPERHMHYLNIEDHTHKFQIDDHEHEFEIPGHTHSIEPGIFRFGGVNNFALLVNNVTKARYVRDTEELNITQMLVNNKGRIERGKWHSIKVLPTTLGYISIDLYIQGFIQSRGEVTV